MHILGWGRWNLSKFIFRSVIPSSAGQILGVAFKAPCHPYPLDLWMEEVIDFFFQIESWVGWRAREIAKRKRWTEATTGGSGHRWKRSTGKVWISRPGSGSYQQTKEALKCERFKIKKKNNNFLKLYCWWKNIFATFQNHISMSWKHILEPLLLFLSLMIKLTTLNDFSINKFWIKSKFESF
jgi:hypothetical protein